MSIATYHGRKRQNLCVSCGLRPPRPFLTRYRACGEAEAVVRQRFALQHRARLRQEQREDRHARWEAPGPNLLAHCGRWHAISDPRQPLACCGYVLATVED